VDFALDELRFVTEPEQERMEKSLEGQDIRVASGTVGIRIVFLGATSIALASSGRHSSSPF
jgi:hypothetical protein